jgi:hypothetical protein
VAGLARSSTHIGQRPENPYHVDRSLFIETDRPNKPDPVDPAIASQSGFVDQWSWVTDPNR